MITSCASLARAGQISCCEQVHQRSIRASCLLMLDGLVQGGGPGGVCKSASGHAAGADHVLRAARTAWVSRTGHPYPGPALSQAPEQTHGSGAHGLHRQQRLDELHPQAEEVVPCPGLQYSLPPRDNHFTFQRLRASCTINLNWCQTLQSVCIR